MATTKAAFRLRCARRAGLVSTLLTTSAGDAGGNTFVMAGLLDIFPVALTELWVFEPTSGEQRRIVNYDPPEGIAFVNRPFSAQVGSAATLYLFRRFAPADYDEALRTAVEDVYPYLSQIIVDTSVETVANQYEYTIPSTIVDLERMMGGKVEMEADTGNATSPYLELRLWDTRRVITTASSTYTLGIDPRELTATRTLRITGLGMLAYPSTDATNIPLDAPQINLLTEATLYNLYAQAQGAPQGDTAKAAEREMYYRALYDSHKDVWGITLEPTDLKPAVSGMSIDLPLAYNSTP